MWLSFDLGPAPHDHPLVLDATGIDDKQSDALCDAIGPLSAEGSVKAFRLLERFLRDFAATLGSLDEVLITPTKPVRRAFESHLRRMGCKIAPALRRRDGSRAVERAEGSIHDVAILIAAATRYWNSLVASGYPHPNPFVVDNHDGNGLERILFRAKDAEGREVYRQETFNYYRVVGDHWSPPMLDDPRGLGEQMLGAAMAAGWPSTPMTLLMCMLDDGPRIGDIRITTAADWATSDFGRVLRCPSKGSDGERVKDVVLSERTRDAIRRGFEERHRLDPRLPNVEGLRRLAALRDVDALKRLPLFPSRWGSSISRSGYSDVYFRPTMKKADVTFSGKTVWPHLARHVNITERVADVFRRTKPGPNRDALLETLRSDIGWKSDQLPRYAAAFLRAEALIARLADQDRRSQTDAPESSWTGQLPEELESFLEGLAD